MGRSLTTARQGRPQSVSISTSPPSTFTGYTATFAPGGPASPVFGSHAHPCHGQTTFPPKIAPWPSGPPRCRQMLSMALISPFTLATQIVLSPQGNSLASLIEGSSDWVAILTSGMSSRNVLLNVGVLRLALTAQARLGRRSG